MTKPLPPFHLAIPVTDLEAADRFYCSLLGQSKGRTASRWIDLNFFGHQVTLHLVDDERAVAPTNPVDGDKVPARHFGVIIDKSEWRALADHLEENDVEFLIPPRTRFAGEVGEQSTFFLLDPSGNALEFKSFADVSQLFAVAADPDDGN